MLDISIIYEDADLLVIDKPPRVVVNKASSVRSETIQEWAKAKLDIKDLKSGIGEHTDFLDRAGIVHRLDKETSGLLLIAKTPQAFLHLQSQFKQRLISKKYITLVHGTVKPREGEINASIGRLPWNRERFGILPDGKEARTSYRVISDYQMIDDFYSLLEVSPMTGRTHQIRIHLKYIGHPVVSDIFYAGRKISRKDLEFCPRLFLHASYLKFSSPSEGNIIELESKLPNDLDHVLDKLKKYA